MTETALPSSNANELLTLFAKKGATFRDPAYPKGHVRPARTGETISEEVSHTHPSSPQGSSLGEILQQRLARRTLLTRTAEPGDMVEVIPARNGCEEHPFHLIRADEVDYFAPSQGSDDPRDFDYDEAFYPRDTHKSYVVTPTDMHAPDGTVHEKGSILSLDPRTGEIDSISIHDVVQEGFFSEKIPCKADGSFYGDPRDPYMQEIIASEGLDKGDKDALNIFDFQSDIRKIVERMEIDAFDRAHAEDDWGR